MGENELNLEPRDDLTEWVGDVASNIIGFVQGIAWVVFAVLLIVAAANFFGASGRSDRLQTAKTMLIFGIVALVFAMYTEEIVGLIRSIFGA